MKTKITLTVGRELHELSPRCLKNWDDVMCTYKRSDYSGVVRSFTSKFEFRAEAYTLLLNAYLADMYEAEASVAVWTINNDWTYAKQFECPLDFTTLQIEHEIISISAIDNSVAAILKANKSTKYEMSVDTDITSDGVFHFDRLPMEESVTYGFTDGVTDDDSAALSVTLDAANGNVIWFGSTASEISIGRSIYWCDDQEDEPDGYMLRAVRATTVKMSSDVLVDVYSGSGTPQTVYIQQIDSDDNVIKSKEICSIGYRRYNYIGSYDDIDSLEAAHPSRTGTMGSGDYVYAAIGGYIWVYRAQGYQCAWYETGQTDPDNCDDLVERWTMSETFDLSVGHKLRAVVLWPSGSTASSRVLSSSVRLSWISRGDMCDIAAYRPLTVLNAILRKLCAGHCLAYGRISDADERLASTILMAAEDVRGITGARLYTSFSDFCGWMEAVYGYTYYLGASRESVFGDLIPEGGGIIDTPYPQSAGAPPTVFSVDNIRYNTSVGKFVLGLNGYWYSWDGSDAYNNPDTGAPWTDRLYLLGGRYYFFVANADGSVNTSPIEYLYDVADRGKPLQEVVFAHRAEIFNPSAPIKAINAPKEVNYSVDASSIYASVEIGYAEQDYDSVNGRDEFNFSATYTTGCNVSTKKLSLISNYRADCYGIEFAAQKRGEDSTDSDSDKDVFFALVTVAGGEYRPDRTLSVTGTLTDAAFNAAYSPAYCVMANAGYIGMQASSLTLQYASSTGNSDVVIDGRPLSDNIVISTPLLTPGVVTFTTDDLVLPDTDDQVCITYDGLTYHGYIKEMQQQFAREEPVKYQLLVNNITPC